MPQPEDVVQLAIKKLLPRSIKRQVADRWKHTTADAVVVSFPKCGRTWLRMLLSMYYGERYQLEDRPLLEFANLHYLNRSVPKIFFTHDENSRAHYTELAPDKSAYRKSRVLYLYRDPRDAIVSQYFHRAKRDTEFEGSLFEFAMRDEGGLRTLIEFYNIWARALSRIPQHMTLSYETLRADPKQHLARVLEFFGEDVDPKAVEYAVEASAFEKMKRIERDNSLNEESSRRLQARDVEDADSYKVRRGKVGGYVDYLEDPEIEQLDEILRTHLSSFYDYA